MTPFVALVLAGSLALFLSGVWCAYVAPIRRRRRSRALDRCGRGLGAAPPPRPDHRTTQERGSTMTMLNKHVVVTTSHRGVFGGVLIHQDGTTVTLKEAQMCVYWSSDVQGVIGLAATGPTRDCRVTRAAPEMVVTDVTSIAAMSPDAVTAWTERPWG